MLSCCHHLNTIVNEIQQLCVNCLLPVSPDAPSTRSKYCVSTSAADVDLTLDRSDFVLIGELAGTWYTCDGPTTGQSTETLVHSGHIGGEKLTRCGTILTKHRKCRRVRRKDAVDFIN